MTSVKIQIFLGLRNNKENPLNSLEDLDWAYASHYKSDESPDEGAGLSYRHRALRILFKNRLDGRALD